MLVVSGLLVGATACWTSTKSAVLPEAGDAEASSRACSPRDWVQRGRLQAPRVPLANSVPSAAQACRRVSVGTRRCSAWQRRRSRAAAGPHLCVLSIGGLLAREHGGANRLCAAAARQHGRWAPGALVQVRYRRHSRDCRQEAAHARHLVPLEEVLEGERRHQLVAVLLGGRPRRQPRRRR